MISLNPEIDIVISRVLYAGVNCMAKATKFCRRLKCTSNLLKDVPYYTIPSPALGDSMFVSAVLGSAPLVEQTHL